MTSARFCRRLMKELKDLRESPPPGISLLDASDLSCWMIRLVCPEDTVFSGEVYTLRFRFNRSEYPISPPEVVFFQGSPDHEHVYSKNGAICLSILQSDGWSPALSVQAVCLSILSMLSSAKRKGRPPDDEQYARRVSSDSSPLQTRFYFHDDQV